MTKLNLKLTLTPHWPLFRLLLPQNSNNQSPQQIIPVNTQCPKLQLRKPARAPNSSNRIFYKPGSRFIKNGEIARKHLREQTKLHQIVGQLTSQQTDNDWGCHFRRWEAGSLDDPFATEAHEKEKNHLDWCVFVSSQFDNEGKWGVRESLKLH